MIKRVPCAVGQLPRRRARQLLRLRDRLAVPPQCSVLQRIEDLVADQGVGAGGKLGLSGLVRDRRFAEPLAADLETAAASKYSDAVYIPDVVPDPAAGKPSALLG
jgi:hypothetical protein